MTAQQLGALTLMRRWHLWADDLTAAANALGVAPLTLTEHAATSSPQ